MRILVVEDNEADTFIIGEAFKDCGFSYSLKFASSRLDAREILSRESFDLILSDFGISTEEAIDFIHHVRTVSMRVPIVILSGVNNPNIAYDAGANAFIRKVSDLQEFIAKIRGLMEFWCKVAELPVQGKDGINGTLVT